MRWTQHLLRLLLIYDFERNALEVDTMLMEYPLYQRPLFIIQNAK